MVDEQNQKRRPNLLAGIRRGRQGLAVAERSAVREAMDALSDAEARLDRGSGLGVREWASTVVRVGLRLAREVGDETLMERALCVSRRLTALDEAEVGPVRARLIKAGFPAGALQKELAKVAPHERDAFARRLFEVEQVPERQTEREPEMVHYVASSIDVIEAVAARLEPDQVFYDVGSGLGFVTMLVSCLTGVRAVGIEYEPAYHAHAVSRAERLGLERVEYRRGDASEADFEEGDVFFFFDPFRGAIFDAVAAKIQQVALQKTIRIVSRGSSSVAFEALSWLEVESRGPHELLTLRSCAR